LKNLRLSFLALFACAAMFGFAACAASNKTVSYNDKNNWLSLPENEKDKKADVFFIYPTCFFPETVDAKSCAITDAGMRSEAKKIKEAHSGIFESARFFAPYYRQLSIGYIEKLGSMDKVDIALKEIPFEDCKAAFETYLNKYNEGRPIIFASHSQGTMVLRQLLLWLKEAHPAVLKRVIAAYMIGFSITPEFIAEVGLPFAQGKDDVGVIISYNSESPNTALNPFIMILPGAMAINPINWRRDETYASKKESLGSRIRFDDENEIRDMPHFADAKLNLKRGGAVQTNAPLKAGAPWPDGVLHRYDFDIFYYDLKKNVDDRIAY